MAKNSGPCEIILDVGHNPAAMAANFKKLAAEPCEGKTYTIFAMLQDKDITQSVKNLSPMIDVWCCVDIPSDRALKGRELFEKIASLTEKECYYYDSVATALGFLLPRVKSEDRLLVTGSFYTVAAALNSVC